MATQQALDASTSHNGSASDYLTWLLRNEEPRTDKKEMADTIVVASLSKRMAERNPLPRNMATARPMPREKFSTTRAVIERVRKGDTLSGIMQRYGVPLQTSLAMVWSAHQVFDQQGSGALTQQFQVGKLIKLTFDREDHIISLDYPVSDTQTLHVSKEEEGSFSAKMQKAPLGAVAVETTQPVATLIPKNKPQKRDKPAPQESSGLFKDSTTQVRDTVRSGDILATLLARHGITQTTAFQVAEGSKPVFDLERMMRPGNAVRLAMDESGQLTGLSYAIDTDNLLWVIRRDDRHFTPRIQKKRFETRLHKVAGAIKEDGSLFLAGQNAGISQSIVIKLAQLLEWDIDFARDIRAGDHFKVVYEVKYYEGRRERDGDVVAVEFTNQGHTTQVLRYTDPSGKSDYYDASGHSVRKMFIRAPVDFTRISSLFSKHRKHPIYGFTRAHQGVDYAAPTGTPVRASGDGEIIFADRKGGYGKLILVRHNDTYTTAYAHLDAFTKGIRQGKRVKQGDVIGRVGSTGASTGPHLHYEVRVNEKQINPLSARLPTADPIPSRYAEDFRFHTARIMAMFKTEETKLAALTLSRSTKKR